MARCGIILLTLVATATADVCSDGACVDEDVIATSLLQTQVHIAPVPKAGVATALIENGAGPGSTTLILWLVVSIGLSALGGCMKVGGVDKLIAEFVGTFMLVFSVGCNVLAGDKTWGVTSIAFTLMVSIYALGSVSGANFNPAVSVALGIAGKMQWKGVLSYVCVQFSAGVFAALSYGLMIGKQTDLKVTDGYTVFQAGLAELLYTFLLTFVVLNVATTKAAEGNQFFGLAIGCTVIAGGYGAGGISGGCFNPAVALGVDSSSSATGFGLCGIYFIFEFIGCALAAVLFRVCHADGGESEDFSSTLSSCLASEFLGTYFLVLTVGLNVLMASPAGAFSIAAALMSMIYALGPVSGAHFNPAVTVACLFSGRGLISASKAAMYIGVQMVAGILAAFTYSYLAKGQTVPLAPKASTQEALVGELIFTFLLTFVVLSVATTQKSLTEFFGLAIGGCVVAGGLAIGNLSGGSLNPAVSGGLAFSDFVLHGGKIGHFFSYAAVEVMGGMFASAVFRSTHAEEYSKIEGFVA